jgi:outer membrane protein OmpA-like peptidoglycan-associated protein
MKKFLLFWLFALSVIPVVAQQSGKSKSRERNREKDGVPQVVRIQNAKFLNSPNTDYGPTYYQNGLVYVSSRQKSGPVDAKTKETFHQLYFAPFDPNGDPANPQSFSLEINSGLHEGPVTFSRDFKTMYFTRNNMHKGSPKADEKGVTRLKVYEAKKGVLDWGELKELSFNADGYSCAYPSLSVDGQRLYFASDMPGGFGGFDLYVSEKQAGGFWGTPVNLGARINTAGNDFFPFIHSSGTLFFSSDGFQDSQGLDMYFVDITDRDTTVVSLGEPFNSKEDDLGFIMNDEGNRGFFASSRKSGLGKDDIFAFTIEQGIAGVSKPAAVPVDIMVTDARTGKPLQGAEIRILRPSADGFVSNQDAYYNIDLLPDPLRPNILTMQLVPKDADEMRRADLLTNADGIARHEFMLYQSHLLLVNLDGYQTAQRVLTLEEGTQAEQVAIVLFDAPVCHRVSGVVSTDQFGTRLANATLVFIHSVSGRRETFRTNLNGEFDVCLPLEGDYLVKVERAGFLPESFTMAVMPSAPVYRDIRLRPTVLTTDAETPQATPMQPGSIIVMDKIVYERNKVTLNESAVRHLNGVFDLMKRYPKLSIELIVHTDTRGEAVRNLELSQERADNAKTYLEYRGIEPGRIKAIGKGETQPRNHCLEGIPCSDEDHAVNARVEMKVVSI